MKAFLLVDSSFMAVSGEIGSPFRKDPLQTLGRIPTLHHPINSSIRGSLESRTKNRKTNREIETLVERAFGDVGVIESTVTEFTAGWFNVTYGLRLTDGREVVLKIAPPPEIPVLKYEENIMSTEVATMRRLQDDTDIPVPVIHFYDTSREVCDADYFFMERMPGKTLSDIKASLSSTDLLHIEHETGKILRAINNYSGPLFGYPGSFALQGRSWPDVFSVMFNSLLEDASAVGVSFDVSTDELRRVLAQHADALTGVTSPCLVHWDLWDTNILIDGGTITGVIDFERVVWSEPLMEAQFRLLLDQGITESMRAYGKTHFSESEMRRCDLYSLYLGMVMCIESVFRAYTTNEAVQIGAGFIARSLKRLR